MHGKYYRIASWVPIWVYNSLFEQAYKGFHCISTHDISRLGMLLQEL